MRIIYIVIALVVVLVGGYLLFQNQKSTTPVSKSTPSPASKQTENMQYIFENPKKSAHFETNTPAHGSILAGVPINVVIDFNFDLAKPSEIKILKDPSTGSGQVDYGVGETIIDKNKLSMRRNMDVSSPDGLYTVEYKACWPDGSCHDGKFQFAVDQSLGAGFIDMTNQNQVTVKMSDIKFNPMDLKITKGTKVTWINDDSVEHYVNTDSHPAHTYYLSQNSKALKSGESYTLTFDTPGIYPYHCSAHADNMTGNILVE